MRTRCVIPSEKTGTVLLCGEPFCFSFAQCKTFPCGSSRSGDEVLCSSDGLPGSSAPATPHPSPAGDTFSSKEKAFGFAHFMASPPSGWRSCLRSRLMRGCFFCGLPGSSAPTCQYCFSTTLPSFAAQNPPSLTQGGLLVAHSSWLPCARGAVTLA